ncbi:p21-activated protein kinase-interacting protein 1 [Fasciolopsis buskii]|uniref:p21-activated protein kinase-interacting protein 1 n=1 Tax=Fasciolopsis buskii TaxID=27845 RepID=A0A8E0VQF0_9TREM|nr:p21-activated protein kinase-interacting protein 1 [Fasciolopsis buski]
MKGSHPFILSLSLLDKKQLFSLPLRSKLGALELHTGTIRQLDFSAKIKSSDASHLFSISDDGTIAIWRRDPGSGGPKSATPDHWECIRVMRRHKGPVRSLALHPSNRCAFSVSEDKTFRVWNLMRGRQAYATRLKVIADGAQAVSCSPSGQRLLFIWPNRFDVIDLNYGDRPLDDSGSKGNTTLGLRLGSVHFEQPMSASPVFFSEDDYDQAPGDPGVVSQDPTSPFVFILAGTGPFVNAFRCPLPPTFKSKGGHAENLGQIKLPGKRIKELRVVSWPHKLPSHSRRHRLVVVATTSATESHIRGYAVNLDAFRHVEQGDSFLPVFVFDVPGARVTSLAVDWTNESDQLDISEK